MDLILRGFLDGLGKQAKLESLGNDAISKLPIMFEKGFGQQVKKAPSLAKPVADLGRVKELIAKGKAEELKKYDESVRDRIRSLCAQCFGGVKS